MQRIIYVVNDYIRERIAMVEPAKSRFPGLEGRVAVVTGATCGIGQAIVLALARHGVAVAASGRNEQRLETLVDTVRSDGGSALAVTGDVTNAEDVERLQRETERALGPVDLVAAVAGGLGEPVPLVQLTLDRWRQTIDVNLTSVFLALRTFLPKMTERRRGSVLTMSSLAGERVAPEQRVSASPAYSAAKAALLMLTRQAAKEAAEFNVRVNSIAPGAIMHERFQRMPAQVLEGLARSHPLGRVGTPDDVAEAALFLLSDASSFMTGVTLDLNGGQRMA
jgi:3-oxoacyl-[acyl-carrier protein] reductase